MLHLVGNGMNENHTMHIQSDSLTCRAQAYIYTHAWGFCLLCCLQFFLFFTTLTQGKKGFMAGRCGNSVSLLFEFMVWQQQIVVERARRSLIVGYTKILGTGSLFLLFSLFRISCQLFLFLSLTDFLSLCWSCRPCWCRVWATEKYKLFYFYN